MTVREINVVTGVETVREYTEKELADIAVAVAEYDAMPKKKTLEERIAALEDKAK